MRTSGSLVLVGLVILLAGCGNATPSPSQPVAPSTPTPTPGAAQSASLAPTDAPSEAPSDAPKDTPEPTPAVVTIPTGALKSMAEGPSVAFGSRVFSVSPVKLGQPTTITMRDFASATSTVLVGTPAGHALSGLAATADRIAWVESWRDHPSPATDVVPGCVDLGKPLRWQILTLVIAGGAKSVIASGTNVRTAFDGACADVDPPVIALDGDRVGYTLEATSPTHPFANKVVVRSISSGTVIRTLLTAGIVQGLVLSGSALAYRDDEPISSDVAFADPFDGSLMVSASDREAPTMVAEHVSVAGLGEGRIAWIDASATDGSIWTQALGSTARDRFQVSDLADFHPDGASAIAVGRSTVAWVVQGAGSDSIGTSRLALWTEGGVGPALVDRVAQPEFVELSGGWLVWDSSADAPDGEPHGLYGVPVSALVP